MMKKMLKNKWAKVSIVVVAVGLIAFNSPNERYFEIAKNLDIFATLYKEVNTYYVDEVNPNSLMKTGIEAMLQTLDPYTNYIPEDDIEDYRTMTTGQYGGIGALIGKRSGKNTIIMPYEGFPAHKVGLQIGDELLEVDGIDVSSMTTTEISKLLKGQANTKLTMTIDRFGSDQSIQLELIREKITINNVPYYGMVTPEVGYIKLSDFTTNAGREVKNALTELKVKGATGVILDLRDNPGGLLNEAVNVSNIFVPKGAEVVSTRGKVTDWNKVYRALSDPVDADILLAVLINSRSASAAEIVAGVIQDYDRGVLLGKKTFGKGLVQATRPLTYNAQLKITTAKYYIPSGRCIQAIDYSHRNEDGSVGKIPDSLKVAFETTNGRTVYDGGGVDPDFTVDRSKISAISQNLITKGLLFEFGTRYQFDHSEIASAPDFILSDQEYSQFITWLESREFDYVTDLEKKLEDLSRLAQQEFDEDLDSELDGLRGKIVENKKKDLAKHRTEIQELLENEIVSRYYFQSGYIEASFDEDEVVQEAVRVLASPDEYKKVLALK